MTRRVTAVTVLFLFAVPAASSNAAKATAVERFERRLASVGEKTRTLAGKFVQHKHLRLFRTEVVTRGRVFYKLPDHLRWETSTPDASTLLVAGKRAELRMPGEQPRAIDLAKNRSVGVLVEQLLIWLGARREKGPSLSRWYKVTLRSEAKRHRLVLTPLDRTAMKRRIRQVTVDFDQDLVLKTIRIRHKGGDRSRIEFSDLRRNVQLKKTLFQ